jgi:hypothetical protein
MVKEVPIDEERGLSVQVADDASDEEVDDLVSRLSGKVREPEAGAKVTTKSKSGS